MSSWRFTNVARPAQYRSTRSAGFSLLSAEQYCRTSPEPTASPAARSSPANATSSPVNGTRSSSGAAGTGGDLLQVVQNHLEIVPVLDYGAQRVPRVAQVRFAQEVESASPVDGLGHTRRLGQVELTEPLDGGDDLTGQRRRDAGLADQDDLDLAFGGRVADPVVQAAPLERVVQLAGAVGGEYDQRRAGRLDRADLGDADLEVGQHLEQERLEFVIGAVDLVDQQHRLIPGPDRLQQRPLQQELRAE